MSSRWPAAALPFVLACGGGESTTPPVDTGTDLETGDTEVTDSGSDAAEDASDCTNTVEGPQPAYFLENALVSEVTEVDCTLSNGEESRCYRFEIAGEPSNHEVGPFCPRNISDGADVAGLWIESGEVYDVDGAFITGLAEF